MNKQTSIMEQLNELINTYDFNVDTLSEYLNLPTKHIEILSQGDCSFLPEEPAYRFSLFDKITSLYQSAAENKDLNMRSALQILISRYKISRKTIAKMAGVETKDVEKILSDPSKKVTEKIKYKIAVTVMDLRFTLKEGGQKL